MEHHEQDRALRKRARILDVAILTAMEGGLASVTHRRISESAEVSLGAIRYYFHSREELLLACVEDVERTRARDAQTLIDALDGRTLEAPALAALLLRAYYGVELSDRDLAGMLRLTVDCSRESAQIAAALARIREDSLNPQLAELLAACGWPGIDASLVCAVLDGSILASVAEGRSEIAERARDSLVGILRLAGGASEGVD